MRNLHSVRSNVSGAIHVKVTNFLFALALGLSVALLATSVQAISYNWSNIAGGNWITGTNWTPTGTPATAGDTATLGNLSGAYTVTLGSATTIGGLNLSGGNPTVTLSSPLTISGGTSNISGGLINGTSSLRLTNNAAVNWTGGSLGGTASILLPTLHSATINNTVGAFALGAGQSIRLGDVAANIPPDITNLTFANGFSNSGEIRLGIPAPGDNYGVYRLIVNSGTITNNAGGNINLIPRSSTNSGAPWNTREVRSNIQNNGTITSYTTDGIIGGTGMTVANSATGVIKTDHSLYTINNIPKLTINGTSFTNDGVMQVGANPVSGQGGHIAINSDTVNFNAGSSITGPGTLELAATTVNINSGASITGLNVMSFGRLRVGPGYASNPTTVNWGIPDLTDPMTFRIKGNGEVTFNRTGAWNLPSNQVLEFHAPDPIGIGHVTSLTMAQDLNNSGIVRMGVAAPGDNYVNAQLNLTGSSTFTNNAGGLVEMFPRNTTNDTTPWFNRYINANVVNNGTINNFSGGGRLGDTGKTVINNGAITIDSVQLTSPRKAELQMAGTSFTQNAGGTINLNNGSVWFNTPTVNYNGGSITGLSGAVIKLGSASIDTNFIYNGGAEVAGPVTWYISSISENTITRSSTWNIANGGGIFFDAPADPGFTGLTVNQDVSNSGLVQMGRSQTPIGDNYANQYLRVNSANSRFTNNANGVITMFPRSGTSTGDPYSIRTLEAELINNGQLTSYTHRGSIGKSIAGIDHVNNGTITLNNSILTGSPQPQLNILGTSFLNGATGVINGNGVFNVTALPGSVFNNSGTLSPGLSAGILTVQGNVNNLPGSELMIEITGSNAVAGVDYDRLIVNGAFNNLSQTNLVVDVASLNLNLTGDVFTILTSSTNFTGLEFGSVTFTGPGNFTGDLVYGNGFIQLINVTSFIPEPNTGLLLLMGLVALRKRNGRKAAC